MAWVVSRPIWIVDMERPVLGASRPGARPSHPWPRAARSGRLAALGHGCRVQVSLAPEGDRIWRCPAGLGCRLQSAFEFLTVFLRLPTSGLWLTATAD